MRPLQSVEDYRRAARRRLPRLVFDYIDGGAETESTVAGNRRAFEAVTFRAHGGMDPTGIDTRTTVMGSELSMPLLLAPVGSSRMVHTSGDLAGARAANRAGTGFVLSTMSGHNVEDVVKAAGKAPVWYQVYRVGPMSRVHRAIERARDAGVKALAITFDTSVGSLRERDGRTGGTRLLGTNRLAAAPHFFPLTLAPRWLAEQLANGIRPKLMNVLNDQGQPEILGQSAPTRGLTWEDLAEVRKLWSGPILIKGLITAADARRAVEEGASGVIVSNHGGRQLDGADATLRVLPEIVAAVGDRCEVLLDGGVRSGIDVMKAVSLGAKAVLIGRPWVFGLGARGEAGVDGVLRIIGDGMKRNMALLGAKSVADLDRSFVRAPAEWFEPDPWLAPATLEDVQRGQPL